MDVGFGLLAADRGGWHCLAIVSAAWNCVDGRRLWHQHHGTTWLAADYGGSFSFARRLRCGTSSEDGASDNLVCYHGGSGWYAGFATRCYRPEGVVRLSMEIVEVGHHCSSSWWRHFKRIRDSEYCGGCGEAPACGAFGEATRARSPTADVARPPCVVFSWRCLRGGLRAIRVRWFHPASCLTMLQRRYGEGPAWQWSSQCGAVRSSRFPIDLGPWLDGDFRR